jgi:hypothetical protein
VASCAHLDAIPLTPVPDNFEASCSDCIAVGGRWVHLRRCLTCDHAEASGHAVVTSAEPGEHWRWCYFDRVGA